MKKTYNTPELNISILTQLDTMTASGLVDSETEKTDEVNNNYMFTERLLG